MITGFLGTTGLALLVGILLGKIHERDAIRRGRLPAPLPKALDISTALKGWLR